MTSVRSEHNSMRQRCGEESHPVSSLPLGSYWLESSRKMSTGFCPREQGDELLGLYGKSAVPMLSSNLRVD